MEVRPIRIESATADDFDDIFRLLCDLEERPLNETFCEGLYMMLLKSNSDFLLVARSMEGIPVGFAHLRVEPQLHHAALVAELMELCVLSNNRGQGIGRELYEATLQTARKAGCVHFEVCCNIVRTRAHEFYEQMGAEKTHWKFNQLP